MKRTSALVGIALLLPTVTGCATIVNGRTQDLLLGSTPAGATVKVAGAQATTPGTVTLKRDHDYSMVFSKEGFPEREVKVEKKVSWWLAGNAIFGGLIGLVIDVVTGGAYKLVPGSADVDMATGAVKEIEVKKGAEKTVEEKK